MAILLPFLAYFVTIFILLGCISSLLTHPHTIIFMQYSQQLIKIIENSAIKLFFSRDLNTLFAISHNTRKNSNIKSIHKNM